MKAITWVPIIGLAGLFGAALPAQAAPGAPAGVQAASSLPVVQAAVVCRYVIRGGRRVRVCR
jgi:hypothetical protein